MKRVLCLGLVLVTLFLAACGSGMSGRYYSENGELYVELTDSTWSMGETDGEAWLSGTYTLENGGISFRLLFEDGEARESFRGELDGNRLVIAFTGEWGSTVFYKDGKKGLLEE